MTIEVFDWPRAIAPYEELYFAGGASTEGLLTLKGVRKSSPEPGGRAFLEMGFNNFGGADNPRHAAWLMSRIRNGAYMRVKICNPVQLVPLADLGLSPSTSELTVGIPFDDGEYFDDDTGFEYDPVAAVAADALEGGMEITIDMGDLLPGLQFGHVFGHDGATYEAMNVTYSGSIATVELSQPLRNAATAGEVITFRPYFTGFAENPNSMIEAIRLAGIVQPGSVRLVEAWV